jgi:hypothetical protein
MTFLTKNEQQIITPGYHWTAVFLLTALEGLVALVAVIRLPSEMENRVFLGLSSSRLILLALIFAIALLFISLAILSLKPVRRLKWSEQLRAETRLGSLLFLLLPVVALLSVLILAIFIGLFRGSGEFRYLVYYHRLSPLFLWGFLASLQAWVVLIWTGDFCWAAVSEQRPIFRASLIIGALTALLVIFVISTGIGITPDRFGWGKPTVPLLEWEVCLAWLCGILFLYFLLHRRWPARADAIMAIGIWLLAIGVWLCVPVIPSSFATVGRPPNYEIYPFSDGAYYGSYAQNILIGNGFMGEGIPARPMYVIFLAFFHLIAGQKYEAVIFIQTLLLALLPVALYFIGRELHSRPAGLVMALFVILREWNAVNALPFTTNASTSKLFFADLPSALAISLFTLVTIIWLKAPTRRMNLPILVGGSLGMVALFRTQTLLILPGLLILALLVLRGHWRVLLVAGVLILSGLFLAVAPWLWRNAQITGKIVFEDPNSQIRVIASRYSLEPANLRFLQRPGESLSELTTRANQEIAKFTMAHPGYVARFISSHFINAEIDNLQLLPLRDGLVEWKEILIPITAFWEKWDGSPSLPQSLLLMIYLGLIVFGMAAAWVRAGWAGMVPLLLNLSYNASSSIARSSGGRYLLPADWAVFVYIAIALMEIAITVYLVLGTPPARLSPLLTQKSSTQKQGSISRWNWRSIAGLGLLIIFIGSLPLMAERFIPRRYPIQTKTELISELIHSQQVLNSGVNLVKLEKFLLQPDTQITKGRALYPRYYAAGDGEPRTAKTGYEPLPYPRTLFLMASNGYNGLIQLIAAAPPAYLSNASDVIVVGCDATKYVEAHMVLILGDPGGLSIADNGIPTQCPVSTP